MSESTRPAAKTPYALATVYLVLFLVITALLILFVVRPVVPVSDGFGVGPTATVLTDLRTQ